MHFRAYCWSEDDIARYLSFRQNADWDLLGAISEELRQQLAAIEEIFRVICGSPVFCRNSTRKRKALLVRLPDWEGLFVSCSIRC